MQLMQWAEASKPPKKFTSRFVYFPGKEEVFRLMINVISLPAPLQQKSRSSQKLFHQLVYQCISEPTTSEQPLQRNAVKFIKFTVDVDDNSAPNAQDEPKTVLDEEVDPISKIDAEVPTDSECYICPDFYSSSG